MEKLSLRVKHNHGYKEPEKVLLTHKDPDLDGLSASFALATLLRARGIGYEVIVPNEPVIKIDYFSDGVAAAVAQKTPDFIIVSDTAVRSRIYYPSDWAAIPLAVIDHHRAGDLVGTFTCINPDAPSVCEYLYDLLAADGRFELTAEVAQYLLDGIVYDTQTFGISTTTAETLLKSAELMKLGADFSLSKERVSTRFDYATFSYRMGLMAKVKDHHSVGAISLLVSEQEALDINMPPAAHYGLINLIFQQTTADLVIVLYQYKTGATKVSFRSRRIDVNALSNKFGGGGHRFAAGMFVHKLAPELLSEVIAELEKLF